MFQNINGDRKNMTDTTYEPSQGEIEFFTGRSIIQIKANPTPKPKEILGTGVLIQGSKACIYASPKVGKSVIATQLGLCCASGMSFLDVPVIQPCNVFYLNYEVDEHEMEQRILQIAEKIGNADYSKFKTLTLLGKDVPLIDTSVGLAKLVNILTINETQGFRVELLILDCRYKTMSKSENQDDNMKTWVRNIEELSQIFKFTLLVVHHKGKDTRGVGAGSNIFDRWINTSFEIRPHHWTSALSPSKERQLLIGGNYTPGIEKHIVLDFPIHVLGGDETWAHAVTKKQQAIDFILGTLTLGEIEEKELVDMAIAGGHTRSTFFSAIHDLQREESIKIKPDSTKGGRHNLIQLRSGLVLERAPNL